MVEAQRILVVDDEEPVRTVIAALLAHAGYTTRQAASAEEALIVLRDEPACRIVMSDVMMPGTDGLALLDVIERDFPGTAVLLCSALHDLHVVRDAFRRGAFDYLLKPFERKDLMTAVERALQHLREAQTSGLSAQDLTDALTAFDETVATLSDALYLRDQPTLGHARRVAAYAVALARAMDFDAATLKVIEHGALLHDIGKLATPEAILLKPGPLTQSEVEIMREHSHRGYTIVRQIESLAEASEIVHAHQEHFDGSGYPRGLSGDQIPLGARIFAIADALDAITTDRPYRSGASFSDALTEIERCSGTQFDPAIVSAFLTLPVDLWSNIRNSIPVAPTFEAA